MEAELETRGEERGNTKEEFSCSLTPILESMLGAEARMNTQTHTQGKPAHNMQPYNC